MKKINLIIVLVLLLSSTIMAQNGANCFTTQFNPNAIGRNDKNAYLLMYLATATYADVLPVLINPNLAKPANKRELESTSTILQVNESKFKESFKQKMGTLMFSNSVDINNNMFYFNLNDTKDFQGYDPECVVVNTNNVIYVSWRGTDRVQNANNDFGYDIREWWLTDFQAIPHSPGNGIVGTVHRGAWMSMLKIADRVSLKIKELKGNTTKKVWITGHSLGAGQAQLFAAYLAKKYNVLAQGVWTFATPQFSNVAFNTDLETMLGGQNRIQRFDFIDDPISCVAQVLPFLKPAGIRNHYTDRKTMNYNTAERSAGEVARIAASIPSALFGFLPTTPVTGGMCYHYQQWYLHAAYNQLSNQEKSVMPNPISLDQIKNELCSSADFSRAENGTFSDAIELGLNVADATALPGAKVAEVAADIAEKGREVLLAVGGVIGNVIKWAEIKTTNAAHTVVPEGNYRIKNYAAARNLAISGRCYGNNNCRVMLWDEQGTNARFKIKANGTAYKIEALTNNTVLDVPAFSKANGTRLQMYQWQDNFIKPGNQQWYFIPVEGKPNHYVIMNYDSEKVLDAHADQLGQNGCEIMQWTATGKGNQVWILERLN
jgi:hypothetical protein